jgi:uncharacterized membrane protein YjfL (UPF0719 family)
MESQFGIIVTNFIYAIVGGFITIGFMVMAYWLSDKLTSFDTSAELAKGNRAVGNMVQGMFIGIGVAVGLVIGLGLN